MSTTTIDLDEKTYGQLLGRALPHVIHTDEESERLTNELLTMLIDEYDQRRYPIRKASPQRTLQHLMEARSLTQKDLWKIFGSKGITSEVFHGKRSISKTQAKKLAEFFHVSAELFI
jgi:HTH-type transcriptional regulator / antitoxin HigA